MEFFNNQS
ncbi:hypothetical protein YPPY66_3921, partial [Yersinia pestis PY-66]